MREVALRRPSRTQQVGQARGRQRYQCLLPPGGEITVCLLRGTMHILIWSALWVVLLSNGHVKAVIKVSILLIEMSCQALCSMSVQQMLRVKRIRQLNENKCQCEYRMYTAAEKKIRSAL